MRAFYKQVNLVCDDSLKTSHAQMIFYFGVLAGDVGFGSLADLYVDSLAYWCANKLFTKYVDYIILQF